KEHEARLLAAVPELEAAGERFSAAIALYERVISSVADTLAHTSFYNARAALYAASILAAARPLDANPARTLAHTHAPNAGQPVGAAARQHERESEQHLHLRGADITREEVEHNEAIERAVTDARKALGK